jgi:hypothetical protein
MVSVEDIKKIVFKCYSIKEIQVRLSSYSRDERTELLHGRLTEGEWLEYNKILTEGLTDIKEYEELTSTIDKDKLPILNEFLNERKQELTDDLFQYDRRIIENYTVPNNPLPSFDNDSFLTDKNDFDLERMFGDDSTIGGVEKAQIQYQQENSNYTDLEKDRMNNYYFNTYGYVNTRLWEGKTYANEYYSDGIYDFDELEYYNQEFPRITRSLDNCISKSPGLKTNTRLFRAGAVDIHLTVGMKGKLKGYTSTSFQEDTAKNLVDDNEEGFDWTIEILAPAGTKGICANDHTNFDNNDYTFEHEYTLGRNQGYTVISMDYENKRQVILLDTP